MDKYAIIESIMNHLEVLADAKGVLRCGLIWDMNLSLKALKESLKKEDEANAQKVEALKAQMQAMESGG